MKNRAKCRLCGNIIESFHRHDFVHCKCKEIAVDGGNDYFRCIARDWANFIRIDDEGNEVIPKVVEKPIKEEKVIESAPIITKKDMIDELDRIISSYENLPEHAMQQSISHYDFVRALLLLSGILRFDLKEDI